MADQSKSPEGPSSSVNEGYVEEDQAEEKGERNLVGKSQETSTRKRPEFILGGSDGSPSRKSVSVSVQTCSGDGEASGEDSETSECDDESSKKVDEQDMDAINRYYENNHYTVTGHYQKNLDTMNKIPANYLRILREQIKDREPSVNKSISSTKSSKSQLPIPGANENRFIGSFYWLAHNHKKIGLRHLLMIALVVTYTFIGAFLFSGIEGPFERKYVADTVVKLDNKMAEIAEEIIMLVEANNTVFTDSHGVAQYIRDAYIQLLKTEEKYDLTAYHKAEDDRNMQWSFNSAFFFSQNVYLTIGYGAIAPVSNFGKFMVMVYGLFTVPLSLVVVRDLGQWALVGLTKMYGRMLLRWRKAQGYSSDEDEDFVLPIKISLGLLAAYLFATGAFVYFYDEASGEPGTGIDPFNAFYFAYITTTTIGLGDTMPNNATYSPLVAIVFFFGMPLMKVINRITYITVENGVFGTVTVLENKLDRAFVRHNEKQQLMAQKKANAASIGETAYTTVTSKPTTTMTTVPTRSRRTSVSSRNSAQAAEEEQINEMMNQFTIRSIATFMSSRGDVYAGDFGRVRLNAKDLDGSSKASRIPDA